LLPRLIAFFPQCGFRNQMGRIRKGEYFTHQPRRFQLLAHRGKQLGEARRANAGADSGKEAVGGGRLEQDKSTEPFGRQIQFQIAFEFSIQKGFHELQQETGKQPLGLIAVGPFELTHFCQELSGLGQIGLKPGLGMNGWQQTVEINHFHFGHGQLQG